MYRPPGPWGGGGYGPGPGYFSPEDKREIEKPKVGSLPKLD